MATLIGTSGNNTFNGTSTSDTMFGQGGNDLLSGSGGNDRLNGGVGNDTLNGGAGEDTADYSTGNFNGVSFQGALAGVGVTVNLNLTGAQNTGGAGLDTLVSIEDVIGTSFKDTLTGNSANNGLMGGNGNDILNGGSGDDWLVGGTGNDLLNGGAGIDSADYRDKIGAIGATAGVTVNLNLAGAQNTGGAGLDTLVSIENVSGNNFNDNLTGNGANNVLSGQDGNDTLNGGNGNDTLYGGNGNDRLFGGSGNDWLRGGNGNDLLDGGGGSDTVSYETATAGVTVVLEVGNSIQPTSGGAGSDQLLSIESVTGSNFNDLISSEFVEDDSIFNGGNGNDNIAVGHSLGSILNGGSGNDSLFMGNGVGTLNGGTGNDHLMDTDGGSVLNGGDGNDLLEAFEGFFSDAILNGGAGADTLHGGGLFNTFDYNLVSDSPAGLGRDKILGFDGNVSDGEGDQIDLSTIDANSLLAGNQAFIWGGSFTAGHLRYVGGVIQGNTDADAAAEFEIQLVGAPTLVVGGANTDILL